MGLLLFIVTSFALAIVTTPILRKKNLTWWTVGVIVISSLLIASSGTYSSCEDGWASPSIGKQGACSWHGGVIIQFNDFGNLVLATGIVIIVIWCAYSFYKEKRQERKNKSVIS